MTLESHRISWAPKCSVPLSLTLLIFYRWILAWRLPCLAGPALYITGRRQAPTIGRGLLLSAGEAAYADNQLPVMSHDSSPSCPCRQTQTQTQWIHARRKQGRKDQTSKYNPTRRYPLCIYLLSLVFRSPFLDNCPMLRRIHGVGQKNHPRRYSRQVHDEGQQQRKEE